MMKRIDYFDFLRGLAILMVVGIHTYSVSQFNTIEHTFQVASREMLNFAVPLFLAISGFFIGQKAIDTKTAERFYDRYARLFEPVRKVGICSFGIYLSHVYVIMIIENHTLINSWLLRWIIVALVSFATMWLLEKALPYKIQKLLGVR